MRCKRSPVLQLGASRVSCYSLSMLVSLIAPRWGAGERLRDTRAGKLDLRALQAMLSADDEERLKVGKVDEQPGRKPLSDRHQVTSRLHKVWQSASRDKGGRLCLNGTNPLGNH